MVKKKSISGKLSTFYRTNRKTFHSPSKRAKFIKELPKGTKIKKSKQVSSMPLSKGFTWYELTYIYPKRKK